MNCPTKTEESASYTLMGRIPTDLPTVAPKNTDSSARSRIFVPFSGGFPSSNVLPRGETLSKRRRQRGVHGSPPLATDDLLVVAFELLRRDKCTLAVSHEAFSDSRTIR